MAITLQVGDTRSVIKSKIDQIITLSGLEDFENQNTTQARTLLNQIAENLEAPELKFDNGEAASSVIVKINSIAALLPE
jgi:hypothetical protein